ncbi:MAG: prolyl oligopeptidase family serine peptidase [Verrucomicrobiales bacterium]
MKDLRSISNQLIRRDRCRALFLAVAVAVGGFLVLATSLSAQGTREDYQRAASLRKHAEGKLLKEWVDARWLPDGHRFWYRNDLAQGRSEFVFVDARKPRQKLVIEGEKIADVLTGKLGRRVQPKEITVEAMEVDEGGLVSLNTGKDSFRFDPVSGELFGRPEKLPEPGKGRKPGGGHRNRYARRGNVSPDRKWKIAVIDGDVVAKSQDGNTRIALTGNGEVVKIQVYWAPDSQHFVAMQIEAGEDHIVHAVESSPGHQVQPRLKSWRYTKPGDRIAITKPRLFNLADKCEIPLNDRLYANPWQIDRLRWALDSSRFTFIYNQRGHQVLRIVEVDASDGTTRMLVEETPDTFVNYFQKQFVAFLDGRKEIIWMSERDGWNHLYCFDSNTGALKNQITKGQWLVRGVDRVDPDKEQIWLRACGIDKDQDPYHVHYCRINFDGTGLVRLTTGDGTHQIRYSPDRRYLIDHYSRVDLPPVHELRRSADGSLVCKLEEADISQLLSIPGWSMPERFTTKGRDGQTDIWGIIHRPGNLDPSKSYPVIEKIYAGPHGQYVPKRFYSFFTAMDLAEIGFIVVVIDGMGTNWRSKAFLDVCWKNLKDAGFPDRIPWIRAAGKKYPYMDVSRVGIYGGSAGGQNALGALLFHPGFYKAAAADCGCHDNRMDKIHWNEGWMGLMGPHYAENSNVTHAHKLEGKLFLTVGELDTNVDPASTMQVVNALIKADKDFELVVVPGAGHGVGETPYLRRRRQDFFVRNLLGVEPRRE